MLFQPECSPQTIRSVYEDALIHFGATDIGMKKIDTMLLSCEVLYHVHVDVHAHVHVGSAK